MAPHSVQELQPVPGFASLEAVALLLHPRVQSRIVFFDMQVYIGPTPDDVIIGCVRYFNTDGVSFDDVGLYRVVATVKSPPFWN
jgi:hypothetical protein